MGGARQEAQMQAACIITLLVIAMTIIIVIIIKVSDNNTTNRRNKIAPKQCMCIGLLFQELLSAGIILISLVAEI
jgi:hypothetical protein